MSEITLAVTKMTSRLKITYRLKKKKRWPLAGQSLKNSLEKTPF
jgi:hypothetical protein